VHELVRKRLRRVAVREEDRAAERAPSLLSPSTAPISGEAGRPGRSGARTVCSVPRRRRWSRAKRIFRPPHPGRPPGEDVLVCQNLAVACKPRCGKLGQLGTHDVGERAEEGDDPDPSSSVRQHRYAPRTPVARTWARRRLLRPTRANACGSLVASSQPRHRAAHLVSHATRAHNRELSRIRVQSVGPRRRRSIGACAP